MKRYFPARVSSAAIIERDPDVAGPLHGPGREAGLQPAHATPVLVELFTSEGCSDCPPADNLLARLDAEQPIVGVHVIALSEHVTYWNHDGWTDPFSLSQMDERQNDYVAHFRLDCSYTPQAVIDGAEQVVGNDTKRMVQAVEDEAAAAQPATIDYAGRPGQGLRAFHGSGAGEPG